MYNLGVRVVLTGIVVLIVTSVLGTLLGAGMNERLKIFCGFLVLASMVTIATGALMWVWQ